MMKKVHPIFAVMAFLTASTMSDQTTASCWAASKKHPCIEQTLVIKASAKVVFEGIQMSRLGDPDRRHLVSHQQDVAIIDEKITDLPIIGSAHLVYKEIEVPFKRIDYLLISSDKFKAFEGSWELTPLDNGRETKVVLKSYSETKAWMPFAAELASSSTVKDINRRLDNLKHWCSEQEVKEAQLNDPGHSFTHTHNQSQLAENTPHPRAHGDSEDADHCEKQEHVQH